VIHALFCISYSQSFHHKISGKWKSAEEKTANKNFCWHGTVLGFFRIQSLIIKISVK
jgi:hypothetical protein